MVWCDAGFCETWHYNFVQTVSTLAVLRQNAVSPADFQTPLDVAACWELVAANVDQMKVWCFACSANFQAQLALFEAEIAFTKLDERVQTEDPTLTDDEHEDIVRTINQQYREAFRHVTHALPRRLKPKRKANSTAPDIHRQSVHSINVSTAMTHITRTAVVIRSISEMYLNRPLCDVASVLCIAVLAPCFDRRGFLPLYFRERPMGIVHPTADGDDVRLS